MRPFDLRTLAIGAVAVLAAACAPADSPVAPTAAPTAPRAVVSAAATQDTTAGLTADAFGSAARTIDRYYWVDCGANGAGEYVHATGNIRYRSHMTRDSSGVTHIDINSNTSQLTGVGVQSGAFYRGMATEHVTGRGESYGGFQSTRIAEMIHFVAPGAGAAFTVQYDTHIEIDENGTVLVWVQDERVSCN